MQFQVADTIRSYCSYAKYNASWLFRRFECIFRQTKYIYGKYISINI